MNGLDQPDLPYQLGRFVQQGWGTKAVVDFMNNQEKTVTVARVDPTATKLLVLKGTLVGSSGWGQDLIGCSVEAVIQPPPGRRDEFLRRRLALRQPSPVGLRRLHQGTPDPRRDAGAERGSDCLTNRLRLSWNAP